MLDGAIKTIMLDDSKTVGELLVTICSRIGSWILRYFVFARSDFCFCTPNSCDVIRHFDICAMGLHESKSARFKLHESAAI